MHHTSSSCVIFVSTSTDKAWNEIIMQVNSARKQRIRVSLICYHCLPSLVSQSIRLCISLSDTTIRSWFTWGWIHTQHAKRIKRNNYNERAKKRWKERYRAHCPAFIEFLQKIRDFCWPKQTILKSLVQRLSFFNKKQGKAKFLEMNGNTTWIQWNRQRSKKLNGREQF